MRRLRVGLVKLSACNLLEMRPRLREREVLAKEERVEHGDDKVGK